MQKLLNQTKHVLYSSWIAVRTFDIKQTACEGYLRFYLTDYLLSSSSIDNTWVSVVIKLSLNHHSGTGPHSWRVVCLCTCVPLREALGSVPLGPFWLSNPNCESDSEMSKSNVICEWTVWANSTSQKGNTLGSVNAKCNGPFVLLQRRVGEGGIVRLGSLDVCCCPEEVEEPGTAWVESSAH